MKRTTTILLVLGLLATGLGTPRSTAFALSVTDLGKMTNDLTNIADSPLGNFHYIRTSLHSGLKPELLFMGTQQSQLVEEERWPVVKALVQFGTFSGVVPWPTRFPPCPPCGRAVPGFNLDHMVYRSRYVAFVNKDLLNIYGKPHARLSPAETALFNRYANPAPRGDSLYDAAGRAANNSEGCCANRGLPFSELSLPLVVVGGYAQTTPLLPILPTDFYLENRVIPTPCMTTQCSSGGYPYGDEALFSDVQNSLVAGRPVNAVQPAMIQHVNAETNILIALICHADGKKPGSVCNRSVIKKLLKHVK